MSLDITIDDNAQEAIRFMDGFPNFMLRAIARAMDLQNEETVGDITLRRLTGDGPFDPSEHRLGSVTSHLKRAFARSKDTAESSKIQGTTVTSSIGTNVEYAKFHEFGVEPTSVAVKAHERRSHLRRVIDRGTGEAKKRRKRVGASSVEAHTRNVAFPERRPIGTGLDERADNYSESISNAIVTAWRERRRNK
jgi:hypothetical protein